MTGSHNLKLNNAGCQFEAELNWAPTGISKEDCFVWHHQFALGFNNETKTYFPCRKVYLGIRSWAINAATTATRPKVIYPIWGLQSKHCIFLVVNFSQFILQHNDLSVVGQYFWECSIWKLICFICSDVFFVFASCECSCCQVLLAQICKDTSFFKLREQLFVLEVHVRSFIWGNKKMCKYSQLTKRAWKENIELSVLALEGSWNRDLPSTQLDTFKWILNCGVWGCGGAYVCAELI